MQAKNDKTDIFHVKIFQPFHEACETTGLSVYFLRKGCNDGTIPHIKCGNKYLINVPLLIDQLNRQSEVH